VNDRGEKLVQLPEVPTDEWGHFYAEYLRHPTGSTSSAYDHRMFDRFEGSNIVFKAKITVDQFNEHYKGVVKAAAEYANMKVAEGEAARAEKAKSVLEAKGQQNKELEAEQAKAREVTFD
jgi:hypothetical protein